MSDGTSDGMSDDMNGGMDERTGGGAMRGLLRAYRVFGYLKLVGALISGVAIFGMMLWIVADVFSRNVMGSSISGSFEISQNYFMPLAVFPALAYVYGSGVLPRMDILRHRMPAAVQTAVTYLLLGLEVVLFAILTSYTWDYALFGMERATQFPAGGTLYPLWPLFFFVPLGFALILVETLFVIVKNVVSRDVTLAMHEAPEVDAL